MTKICRKCRKEKELEDFHLDRSRKDGRKYICKECLNTRVKSSHSSFDVSLQTSIYTALKKNKEGLAWERIIKISLKELTALAQISLSV